MAKINTKAFIKVTSEIATVSAFANMGTAKPKAFAYFEFEIATGSDFAIDFQSATVLNFKSMRTAKPKTFTIFEFKNLTDLAFAHMARIKTRLILRQLQLFQQHRNNEAKGFHHS